MALLTYDMWMLLVIQKTCEVDSQLSDTAVVSPTNEPQLFFSMAAFKDGLTIPATVFINPHPSTSLYCMQISVPNTALL